MTALLTAEVQSARTHLLQHVAVANTGANNATSETGDEIVESVVAHHRDGQRVVLQRAPAQHGLGGDGHELVTVESDGFLVAKGAAIRITVMRDARLRLALADDALDLLGVGAAALFVDVEAVRLGVEDLHVGTELLQGQGAGERGGAVGVVERDPHAVEADAFHRGDGMGDVAVHAIGEFGDSADAAAFRAGHLVRAEHKALDRDLCRVAELVTVAVDEFDAVVGEGVVGGGNDDAETRTELRTEHRDGGRGDLPGEDDIDAR